jgi:hypothetical protein
MVVNITWSSQKPEQAIGLILELEKRKKYEVITLSSKNFAR